MAITVRGVNAGSNTIGSASVSLPGSLAAGDLVIIAVESANEALTTPAGWAPVPAPNPVSTGTAGGTTSTRLSLFYRFGTGAGPTIGDPGNHMVWSSIAFIGVDTTDPFEDIQGDALAVASTTMTFPAATTLGPDRMIALFGASHPDSAANHISGFTNANLTSLTERFDNASTAGNGGGVYCATGLMASAGSTGTTTATLVTTSNQGRITIALKPASTGPVDPAPADTQSVADALTTNVGKALADTATATDSPAMTVGLTLADTASATDAAPTTDLFTSHLATPSDSVTASDALVFSIGKALADAPTLADALVFSTSKALADTVAPTDALANALSITAADTATATDSAATSSAAHHVATPSDSVTAADAVTLQFGKAATDTATAADANVAAIGKALADTATPTDAPTKTVATAHADSVTATDSVTTASSISALALADSVTPTDALVRALARPLADSVELTDAPAFAASKTFADSVAPLDLIEPRMRVTLHIEADLARAFALGEVVQDLPAAPSSQPTLVNIHAYGELSTAHAYGEVQTN